MTSPLLNLTIRLSTSAADSRRGVIRLHPEVFAALGLREWDAVTLTGARVTSAVAAFTGTDVPAGVALLDDITLSNLGLRENALVGISPAAVAGAAMVTLNGSASARASVTPEMLRQALLGKVVTPGDTVSLLPRDLGPELSRAETTRSLANRLGMAWTTELLGVASTSPGAPVSIQPSTACAWSDAGAPVDAPGRAAPAPPRAAGAPSQTSPAAPAGVTAHPAAPPGGAATPPPTSHLVGAAPQAATLAEWIALALDNPEILAHLGASSDLGVLVTGPDGVGKATLVRSVARERHIVEIAAPFVGALEGSAALAAVRDAVALAITHGGVLLVTDVDRLLPAESTPTGTLVLAELRRVVDAEGVCLVATTAEPEGVDPRLRGTDLCDRVLTIALPDAATRVALLELLVADVPSRGLDLAPIGERTPGFVVEDLRALVREAALRAAARAVGGGEGADGPRILTEDLEAALGVIRPISRSGTHELSLGSVTLDDVGDMVETKQALTESVLWPLQHPDSFARLGVEPPRGVLLYGPPGCGKTFLVRALAATGRLTVHVVKGAELMDKWVGSSEKAVRDLFARARDTAPSLVFLDEVDALASRRGQSADSGVGDRVVAALLTELDGVEQLRDVVVVGATNRPELIDPALLRPGRLEKLVFVPPPDADARAEILRVSAKKVPLADDVSLPELAGELGGYSAADCAALLREAALTAMRRSLDATDVTAADVDAARRAVRPSLDPAQVADLQAFADRRDS